MPNIFDLSIIHEWAKEDIKAYGSTQAAKDHADRAVRADALIPDYVKYVEPYGEALAKKAVEIWKAYSLGQFKP